MEFKVGAKAVAASLAPAPMNHDAHGRSRFILVSGPTSTRAKALRAASNSVTLVAKALPLASCPLLAAVRPPAGLQIPHPPASLVVAILNYMHHQFNTKT